MSWLNLNQSLNSLKGQLTNFATEVLSEAPVQESGDVSSGNGSDQKAFEEKFALQEQEITAQKKLIDELQTTLQAERISRKNGVKEDESSWYWDPPSGTTVSKINPDFENDYKNQIHALQNEISHLRQGRNTDHGEELRRLREENKNLTMSLEDLDSQHQLAMERLLALKKELQKNFEVLKREHEDLKNSNDDYSAEINQLQAKLDQRDIEIKRSLSFKTDYDTLHHKYQNLERVHSLLKETTEKFQEENQDLHEEVFKLQEQVTKLEHDLEMTAKGDSDTVPKERYEELLKELSDRRHSANRVNVEDSNIDDNAKSVIEKLKREISELKSKLAIKDYDEHDTTKFIKCDKILQLYDQYVNFDLPVDYIWNIPSPGNNNAIYKVETAFKTLNEFKKDIDSLEHAVTEKGLSEKRLQLQIGELTSDNDLLNADVQNYYSELNEMKKNNDFLLNEITALKNASKLQPIIESHEDNIVKLESELADSNRMNTSFQSEIQRIEQELSHVRSEKDSLESSLHELKEKYNSMLQEVEYYKEQTNRLEELQNDVHSEQFGKATQEIDNLKKNLIVATSKVEQLSLDRQIIENEKILLIKKVDDLKNELKEATILSTIMEDKLKESKVNTDIDKQTTTNLLDTLKNELTDKSVAYQELLIKHAVLENILAEKQKTVDDLTDLSKMYQDLLSENTHLKNKFIEFEKKMESEKEILTKQIEELGVELNVKSTEYNELQSNYSTLVLKLREIEEINKKLHSSNQSSSATAIQEHSADLKPEVKADGNLVSETLPLSHTDPVVFENDKLKTEVTELTLKIQSLTYRQSELLNEIDVLKNTTAEDAQNMTSLKQTLNDLQHKNYELLELLEKTHNSSEELQKLKLVLNNKDSEIDSLNNTVTQYKTDLDKLKKALDDFKNNEKDNITKSLAEIQEKLNSSNEEVTKNVEKYNKLINEKVSLENKLIELNKTLSTKDTEIKEYKLRLNDTETICKEHKTLLDNKTKEIETLNNHLTETTEKIKVNELSKESTRNNDELNTLIQEKQSIILEFTEKLKVKEKEVNQLKLQCDGLEKKCVEQNNITAKTTTEKNELINLITLKHNECVQYHNEILRLNQVILEQNNENAKVLAEKDVSTKNCPNCETLSNVVNEKDKIISNLSRNTTVYESTKTELENARVTISKLSERCDNLDKSLTIQLETVKKLTTENAKLSETELTSSRELERLRQHLVETEENYTQELMASEQKLTECQTRLHQVEERFKQNSTVYTSNSIRANQEVETLRNQIRLLEKQRDDYQNRLSEAEDVRSRSEAALTNLQVVLEQFQQDKERDLHAATEKLRNKMADMKRQNGGLKDEIEHLNAKLNESLTGLQAANRLGDQLETKSALINDLKEQVRVLQASVQAAEERYYSAISNQQDKVDKNLVKNLLLNYIQTANQSVNNRAQVLRVLSTVLDFNQRECERLGLVKTPAAPTDSLAKEFVRFLEKESRPAAILPNMMDITNTSSSRSSTPTTGSNTLHRTEQPTHKRNTSTGSQNVLFQNLDGLETSSQISIETGSVGSGHRKISITNPVLDSGVTQTRNNEGAILKQVLKDM